MYLILGLGNPGPRYEVTRHNLGFIVVDHLADKYRIQLDQHKHNSLFGKGKVRGQPVVIAKPLTYMNESGQAAKAFLKALSLSPEQLIVVHDEVDLALGKIKRKFKGGDAGNRGIGSIIECLGTDAFARVRVGIGRPEHKGQMVDYVLSPFLDEELPQVNEAIERSIESIELTLKDIHNQWNQTTQ